VNFPASITAGTPAPLSSTITANYTSMPKDEYDQAEIRVSATGSFDACSVDGNPAVTASPASTATLSGCSVPFTVANNKVTLQVNFYVGLNSPQAGLSMIATYTYTPSPTDLAITAVVPVQVVHNWPLPSDKPGNPPPTPDPNLAYKQASLPLIANKRTVVRVFIKSVGTNPMPVAGVSARLHGYFSSPTTPEQPDNQAPFTGAITAQPYTGPLPITSAPDFNEKSVDFELPLAWLQKPGLYAVSAELVLPPNLVDTNPTNNMMQVPLTLVPQPSSTGHND
jgi:hypothetical protein